MEPISIMIVVGLITLAASVNLFAAVVAYELERA
jgi:hypothetical protein